MFGYNQKDFLKGWIEPTETTTVGDDRKRLRTTGLDQLLRRDRGKYSGYTPHYCYPGSAPRPDEHFHGKKCLQYHFNPSKLRYIIAFLPHFIYRLNKFTISWLIKDGISIKNDKIQIFHQVIFGFVRNTTNINGMRFQPLLLVVW